MARTKLKDRHTYLSEEEEAELAALAERNLHSVATEIRLAVRNWLMLSRAARAKEEAQ